MQVLGSLLELRGQIQSINPNHKLLEQLEASLAEAERIHDEMRRNLNQLTARQRALPEQFRKRVVKALSGTCDFVRRNDVGVVSIKGAYEEIVGEITTIADEWETA